MLKIFLKIGAKICLTWIIKNFFDIKEVGNTPNNNISINYLNDDMANASFKYKIYCRMPKEVYICGEFEAFFTLLW